MIMDDDKISIDWNIILNFVVPACIFVVVLGGVVVGSVAILHSIGVM